VRSDRYANPADDPEAHPFLKAIASSNGNSLPRLVFADWLEEHGYHNAAAGQRWAAKHGKSPAPIGPGGAGGWIVGGIHATHTGHQSPAHLSPYNRGTLPLHFFQTEGDADWHRSKLFNKTVTPEEKTFHPEHAFLDATHRIDWNEHGEPVNPFQDE
jgi:uncharacterized protein (TIGR02996 family)